MKAILNNSFSKKEKLPALTENTFWRYFNFIALYIAQGIPEGMLFYGLPAWMAMHGKTPGEIGGLVAMAALPWSFKIIVAPLMDRYSFLPMGRRRPWVLFGQFGLVCTFAGMSMIPDPLNHLNWLMWAVFVVSSFGALQDVATDGMAVDVIPVSQQARANGLMWGAKIAGISASLAIGTWLLNNYGFQYAILSLSTIIGLIMLVPLFLKERPGEKVVPWTKGCIAAENNLLQSASWIGLLKSLGKVFLLKNSLLLATVGFVAMISFNYLDTLLPVFTVQALGWTNETYAQQYASASLTGGIGGMLIGGILIDRFGKRRMMNIYFFAMIVSNIVFVLMNKYWQSNLFITGFMVAYQVLYVFFTIGFFAAAMQCCWKKVSATQFTLYMALSNLGRAVGAALLGPMKKNYSWEYAILAFSVILAIAWLILTFINFNKQHKQVSVLNDEELLKNTPAFH